MGAAMKRAVLNAGIIMAATVALETHYLIAGGMVTLFLLAAFAGLREK